jgi:SSS family transporter
VFFLIAGTLAAGVRVYVTCIPIQLMLGMEVLPAILLFVVLSLAYTYVGGIKAVVWTDFVQFFLFMAGGLFTLWFVPTLMEGGFSDALRQAADAGKLDWFNPGFSLSFPYNIWMGVIGATVMVMSTHGADQLIVQRVLSCGSVSEGRKALALSAVVIFPLFLIFLLAGTMLWVYYQHFEPGIPLPETQAGFSKNDYIFPIFILTQMPPVIKGFMIVAILAAAMSSVSSALSALASVSTMDLFKGITKRNYSEEFYLRFSKYSTLFWGLILIFVAYASREVAFVLNWAFSLNGLTNGAMLGGLILALWWKRGRATPILVGMISALVTMIAISQFTWTRDVDGVEEIQKVAWPWFTLIGLVITISVAAIVRSVLPASNTTNSMTTGNKA